MTVNTIAVVYSYSPGSAMAAEGIPFPFLSPGDVQVTHIAHASGVRTTLALDTNYTIAGDGPTQTATITAVATWPALDTFELVRVTPQLQPLAVPAGQPLPSKAVERELDRLAMGALEATDRFARALLAPPGESVDFYLPTAADRADKLAKWGALSDGAPLGYLDLDVEALAAQVADDAAQTAADRVQTGADVESAQVILDQVTANTAAYGSNVRVFATKAAATAAIGTTLVNGMFAEIMSDEADLNQRTRRPVTSGVLQAVSAELPKLLNGAQPYFMSTTFTRFIQLLDPADNTVKPFIAPHVYIDEYNGLDTNDGLHGHDLGSGKGPIKTIAKLITMPQCVDGLNLAIRYYSDKVSRLEVDFAEPNTGNGNKTISRLSVVPYDNNGKLLRMWGTDPATAGASTGQSAITAHATIGGAYEIQWTHKMYQSATAAIRVLQKQANLDFEPIHRVATEAECSTAGRYWYDSSLSDAGTERIVFKPWAGVNAATAADGTFEITRRRYAVSGRDDCFISGIWGFAHGCNNGSFFTYTRCVVQRCLAELGGKHCAVWGSGYISDYISINGTGTNDYWPEGGPTLMVVVFEGDMTGKSAILNRVGAICDDTLYTHAQSGSNVVQTYYAHAASGGPGTLLQFNDCWHANMGTGGSQTIFNAVEMNGYYSPGFNVTNSGILSGMGFGSYKVRGSVFVNSRRECSSNGTGAVTWDVQNCIFISSATVSGALMLLGINQTVTAKSNVFLDDTGTLSAFIQIDPTGSTIDIEKNVFARSTLALDFGTTTTSATSILIDYNYYDLYPNPPGSTDSQVARFKNHLYKVAPYDASDKDFATDWQGVLGFDVHGYGSQYSGASNNNDTVKWLGNTPTSANPELAVLDPTSVMYSLLSLPSAATIAAMKARPTSRAAAVAYLEGVSSFPVYAG